MSGTGRDLAKGTVVTLIPTGLGFLLSGPEAGIACLFVAGAISLILWTPLGEWLGFHSGGDGTEAAPREPPFHPGDLARQHTSLGGSPRSHTGRIYGGGAIDQVLRQQETQREREPELAFGQVHVPRDARRVELGDIPRVFTGRVLRVPVINAIGKDTAKSVQALLTFCPDDTTGWMSPRDPALAEWDVEPVSTTVDIPGNGIPALFNVAFTLDAEHVCVHQWTRHSREAKLEGYGIAGKGVIKVEVRGVGTGDSIPSLTDTLHIEALEGSLCAQWESEGLGTRKNCAPWPNPRMLMPLPGTRQGDTRAV